MTKDTEILTSTIAHAESMVEICERQATQIAIMRLVVASLPPVGALISLHASGGPIWWILGVIYAIFLGGLTRPLSARRNGIKRALAHLYDAMKNVDISTLSPLQQFTIQTRLNMIHDEVTRRCVFYQFL